MDLSTDIQQIINFLNYSNSLLGHNKQHVSRVLILDCRAIKRRALLFMMAQIGTYHR